MQSQQQEILAAIKQICDEKNIPYESVIATVEAALAVAYRKDFADKNQNIQATFDTATGAARIFDVKKVVTDEFVAEAEKEREERERAREEEEKLRAEGIFPPPPTPSPPAVSEQTPPRSTPGDPVPHMPAEATSENPAPVAEGQLPPPSPPPHLGAGFGEAGPTPSSATAQDKPQAGGEPLPPPLAPSPDSTQDKPQTEEEVSPPEEEKKERYDPKAMTALSEAKKIKADAEVGEEIRTELFPPAAYGRMAAQTAKQVIIQRIREAERETIFKEFKGKEGAILTGTIQRVEGRMVLVDLGHATALMPPGEQISREQYLPGLRLKVFLAAVNATQKGPEIVVSRAHPEMVRKLFSLEVPEVNSGAVEIRSVAREAGSRTKIAVFSNQKNIDPVGSCVGQRGTRVQTIISELGGEKIDIIEWSDDPVKFLSNALSPAKVISVKLDGASRTATAEVRDDQLSLAIGRAGQNVRLAAKLTGWRIDIVGEGGERPASAPPKPEVAAADVSAASAAAPADAAKNGAAAQGLGTPPENAPEKSVGEPPAAPTEPTGPILPAPDPKPPEQTSPSERAETLKTSSEQ